MSDTFIIQPLSEDDRLIETFEFGNLSVSILSQETGLEALNETLLLEKLPFMWKGFKAQLGEYQLKLPMSASSKTEWQLTIVLTADKNMQALNQQFRNKETSTDVLTFPAYTESDWQTNTPLLPEVLFPEIDLGVVLVSVDWAAHHAESENKTVETYVAERIIHGWLHLFGFHHDTDETYQRALSIQNKVLTQCGFTVETM